MQKQVNVQRVQLGQEANKILQAAAEPIDRTKPLPDRTCADWHPA
jgi:hypothetical protein